MIPNFHSITLEERLIFTRFLSLNEMQVSELTFTNLFMWRNHYNFRFAVYNELLCIIAIGSSIVKPFAFFPIGQFTNEQLSETIDALENFFLSRNCNLRLAKVSETQIGILEALNPENVTITDDRDNYDYLYLTKDLISLKGKKYHDKRNHISRFQQGHSYKYIPLTEELMIDGKMLLERWYAGKNNELSIFAEKDANFQLLDNFRALGCKGALLQVDGVFQALSVGEMLNANTAVIHLEKASREIPGLYAMVNQQFCEQEWQNALYINREQDLGIDGLKQAKQSYNPTTLIKKYTVEYV